jgi:uncharacterized membrane protein
VDILQDVERVLEALLSVFVLLGIRAPKLEDLLCEVRHAIHAEAHGNRDIEWC